MKDRTMTMDTSEFDLDKYLRASRRVDLSTWSGSGSSEHPVTTVEARCLTYMMDIETHTVVFLRDLLATRASFDPEVTAFLSCWVYEELWHGEAFSRFLGEAGFRVPPTFEGRVGRRPVPHPRRPEPMGPAEVRDEGIRLPHRHAARIGAVPRFRLRAHDLGRRQRTRHADRVPPHHRARPSTPS